MIDKILKKHIFVFGIVIYAIIYFIMIMNMYPLHTPSEELGAMSGAAFIAGYDWSAVVSSDCNYYGVGFYSICFPFFKFIKNPVVIYRCIIGVNALIRIFISIISYYIGKRFLEISNTLLLSIVSLLIPLVQVSRISRGAHNDLVLDGLLWIVVLLVCCLLNAKSLIGIIMSGIGLSVSLLYGMAIHTRWIIVIFVVPIMLMIVCMFAHKKWIYYVPCLVITACLYPFFSKVVNQIKEWIWITEGPIHNGNISVSEKINYFSPTTWKLWTDMILGNIGTWIIVTGGLASFVIIALSFWASKKIRTKKMEGGDCFILTISGISILCMVGTLLGLLVSNWTSDMMQGYILGQYNSYSFKAMTYLRYWGAYASPLVICAIAIVDKYDLGNKYKNRMLILDLVFVAGFIFRILPYIKDNEDALKNSFSGICGMKYDGEILCSDYFAISIVLSLQIMIIIFILFYRNKIKMAMTVWLVFLSVGMISGIWNYDIPQQISFCNSVNGIVSYYRTLKDEDQPETLYVVEQNPKWDNNRKQSVLIQFYLFDKSVSSLLPEKFKEGDAIVSREDISDKLLKEYDYEVIELDENEFWYWIQ